MESPSRTPDFAVPAGRLVVLGDSRPRDWLEFVLENDASAPGRVFTAAAKAAPPAVLHLGDLAVYGARASFWQGWRGFDADVRPLRAARIPLFPVLGNHEYRGFGGRTLRHYFARFPWLEGRRWYTLRSGTTLVVVLDSNLAKLGPALAAAQDRWFAETIALAEADPGVDALVLAWHHPPFTNVSRRYGVPEATRVRRRFVPVLGGSSKLRVVFSGHVHTFEHLEVDGRHWIVSGGAGSPRFRLRPSAAQRRRDLHPNPALIRPFHYVAMTTSDTPGPLRFEMVAVLDDGELRVDERFAL